MPTWAHPAMLRSASTTAVPNASFFIFAPHDETTEAQDRRGSQGPLVQKRHTSHLNRCVYTFESICLPGICLYGGVMMALK